MNTLLDLSEINHKIGQIFMSGIPGTQLDEDTELLIRDFNLGGIILFARNIDDPVQLAKLCRDIQNAARKYHGNALLLAVDQEGGRVARLGKPFTVFPGNEAIASDNKPIEKAREFGKVTAKEMRVVGLNMNLAPVVDVKRGKLEKHLKGRVFGEDHETVSLLGRTVVKALQENGVMAVAKHFPGLGYADKDPHLNLPRIDMDIKEINAVNIPPFSAAIEEGVSGVMTSHAIYPALDPELPATMSSYILKDFLRERLGFQGLIITDDLEMGAIAEKWGVPKAALASFNAGADILLICEDQNNIRDSLDLIREKILLDEIKKERLSQSIARILRAKSKFISSKEKILLKNVKKYFSSKSVE